MKKDDIKIEHLVPTFKDARRRTRGDVDNINFELDPKYLNLGIGKKYLIQTYGCQANEADSEVMAGILEKIGFEKTDSPETSDLIILNTCAIRENAENRIWGEIGRLSHYQKTNPDLIIGLAGCMPQEPGVVERILKKQHAVGLVFGTHNIHLLPEYIYDAYLSKERVIQVYSKEGEIIENLPKIRNHKFKAWVNIMYGCDEFCTYCIVPYTRGKERSRLPEDIIDEVKKLVSEGYQEVTLLGQNVNAYGKDFIDLEYTLGDLLFDLDKTGIPRIRFTTSHPRDLDLKTILAMKELKSVMPHLHLPVQSGSNEILRRMNRKYTKEVYMEKVNLLKEHVKGISITTDIIVGFPNETTEDFNQTLDLVKEANFEGAYTFIYSKRKGTPAATFPDDVSDEVKKERLLKLNEFINAGFKKGNERFLNEVLDVLVDGPSERDEEVLAGYTPHNKLINFKGPKSLIGQIVKVKVTKALTWSLQGKLCQDER
ncbi:MAG TPA: tRNA (N6-isopentenyl adenosine(37)-C2)-methylthiotransferase MiaB [Acholeplasmataceae bacterium]|nr:tRNA (N6-isopentenyl adenosine(37)-C2)-methylthiotransferase MiaB [Acholeplasmataceae bacterium]